MKTTKVISFIWKHRSKFILICMAMMIVILFIARHYANINNIYAEVVLYCVMVVLWGIAVILMSWSERRSRKLKWQDEILLKAYRENALHADFYDKWIEEEYTK